ncbi:MAG: bifunctional UDP-N-acetylglucosamine diphosphorylase/glucosamine-1-phosphate N-acetyltransferase GlmU [Polyangiaceae bacterium]|nr:bifunctional UDP-N-acetylglucosamine diphosphorylase/glucosamine-1-phosphate N-acetyltransferase GlmU [Polyangiaceae bacterium]
MTTTAIVLAAGQGTRMKSALPKVMHPVAGAPMIHHVVTAALSVVDDVVVVVGHGRELVTSYLAAAFDARVRCVVQEPQRGTGHAAQVAMANVDAAATEVLVLCGDTPLLGPEALAELMEALSEDQGAKLALLHFEALPGSSYGRVLLDDARRPIGIVEARDCTAEQFRVRTFNAGVYAFRADFLRAALPQLRAENAQKELYLTDTVALAKGAAVAVLADEGPCVGVNDRAQLAYADGRLRTGLLARHIAAGVAVGPGAVIDALVTIGPDAVIGPHAVLRGRTRVEGGAHVDVGCVLDDVVVRAGARLKPYSVLSGCEVGEEAHVGPFSHLRPGSRLHRGAHVGNFVETKNTTLREGAKANHLAYLGDGEIGERANVGAGTIFCNYDGYQKHRTTIGAGAFIGCDTQLVAPVTVGEGAYVATGTTVTKDVPPDALAIGRVAQSNKEGYASRLRGRLRAAADAAKAKKPEGGS